MPENVVEEWRKCLCTCIENQGDNIALTCANNFFYPGLNMYVF